MCETRDYGLYESRDYGLYVVLPLTLPEFSAAHDAYLPLIVLSETAFITMFKTP